MAIGSEIERAILSIIDVGTFQNLCNAILDREIHAPRTSLGSQSGTNKTTAGTPDTYYFDGNSYIFVEYTTTENESTRLFNKINKDLNKCLDESETNIPINKIKKIIYCHTSSNLPPDYTSKLTKKCTDAGTELEIWGINELARKIKNNYPYIAEEYLSLDIGNGQIFDLESFIERYDCNETAASLETKFMFRENELTAVNKSIIDNKVTIITGKPGVGKTRLTVELLHSLSTSYNILCIKNNYTEFGNDFTRYINLQGNNLIFVDDANIFDNRLLSILELLNSPKENIRILLTVRENFVPEIEKKCSPYSEPNTIYIKKFSDEQIQQFLQKNFNINNPEYIKQIQRICEGNARLAYFAGKIALDDNGYKKIHNAEQLFENYYENYLEQSYLLNDKTIITAGIISVAGMLDKNNLFNYDKIFKLCKITKEDFLQNCEILNEKEILNDLNGNVTIDEQCINNYFTYQFLYKKKFFTLEDFLTNCFDLFPDRIITSFNNIFAVFYSEELFNYVSNAVKHTWNFFIGKNNEERFVKAFCILAQENALEYLLDAINNCSSNSVPLNEIQLDNKRAFISDPIIEIIGQMSKTDKIQELIELLCLYVTKCNKTINDAVLIMNSRYHIDNDSYKLSYWRENQVIDSLLKYTDSDIIKLLFLESCKTFLTLISDNTEEGRHRTIVFSRIIVKYTKESKDFRSKIWEKLLDFSRDSFSIDKILNLIRIYSSGWDEHIEKELLKFDSEYINKILEILYPENKIKVLLNLNKTNTKLNHFSLPPIKLSNANDAFLVDVINTFEEFRGKPEERKKNIKAFIKRNPIINSKVMIQFVQECSLEAGYNQVNNNFENYLMLIDNDSFFHIFKEIIASSYNINIHPAFVYNRLWKFIQKDEIHDLIWNSTLENINEWQFFYFETMPKSFITNEEYNRFIEFLKENSDKDIHSAYFRDLAFIDSYTIFDKDCISKVYSIIKDKHQYNTYIFSIYVDRLFNNNYEPFELCNFFKNEISLLFDLYMLNIPLDSIFDHEGNYFIYFLDNYEEFRKKIEDSIFRQITSDAYIDSLPEVCKFIIKSDYFEVIMDSLFNRLSKCAIFDYQIEKISLLFSADFAKTKEYVYHFIDKNYQSQKDIQNLFISLMNYDWNTKFDFIIYFLNKNDNFELFSSLQIHGFLGVTTTGGFVAQYESELCFWDKLLKNIPNGLNFIKHKQYCSNQIQIVKKTIENEKIREKYTSRLFFNEY